MKKQFIFSLIASVSRVVLGFVFFWQVSRALGIETLGEYLYLTSALGYFGTLIDYGFNLFILNMASRSEGGARSLFMRVMLSKLLLTVVSVVILLVFYQEAFSAQGLMVTSLFFAGLVLQSFYGLYIHFYKALGRFDYEFTSTIFISMLPVAVLFVVGGEVTIQELAWIVLLVRFMVLLYQHFLFLRQTVDQHWIDINGAEDSVLKRTLKDIRGNFKYAVFSVLGALFLSSDLVVMRFVLGAEEVSIYGTAMKVVLAAILFFEVLNGTFTPRLARSHESGNAVAFRQEVRRFSVFMLGCAIFFSLGMAALGPYMIVRVFGEGFAVSGEIVRLLAFVFILRVMEMTTGPLLTIYGQQGSRAAVITIVLPVHVGLNLLLQSKFGVWGAAYALAFSFLLLFILNSTCLWRAIRAEKNLSHAN